MLLVTYQLSHHPLFPGGCPGTIQELGQLAIIISVTNSADIRVYSYGLWDGGVTMSVTVHLNFQPHQYLSHVPSMTTLLSWSLLIVLDDYALPAPYSNIIVYPLMINPPKWFRILS